MLYSTIQLTRSTLVQCNGRCRKATMLDIWAALEGLNWNITKFHLSKIDQDEHLRKPFFVMLFVYFMKPVHHAKSVRIRSYSGPHYSVRMRENADQNNSEYGHFLRSVPCRKETKMPTTQRFQLINKVILYWLNWFTAFMLKRSLFFVVITDYHIYEWST